ncbi:MAG: ABC transporter ATP-binding protein [Thermoleophilia bacterium]|jgi:branched-chain amino acid transport system ATP-binding protein|nr:ABC transporter ATP-binding protein [Thermoleophilia bacterium]
MSHLLELENLTRQFGGLTAVNDLSFHLDQGEVVGLIGPNGAGKTTAFNVISGALKPSSGTVRFKGEVVSGLKAHQVTKRGLTRTFQVVQPFPEMSALENVMIGAFARHRTRDAAEAKAAEVLERIGMKHKSAAMGRDLTLLELKRLEIGKALATEPELLLLDEVAAGLTPVEIDDILDLVRKLNSEGMSLLVVEHVMKVIMSLSDRIVVLNFGLKIAEGTPKEIASDRAVLDAYLGEEV